MSIDKIIITNVSALKAKYGSAYAKVKAALAALAASDKQRGLKSKLIAIDSSADMKAVRGRAVSGPHDQRGAKAAIDAIAKKHGPDYIVILGAQDVVPHIVLTNPMVDDGDPHVPSDLPYACDVPYSRDPARFLGPTRVVGRIPDQVGASDPALLVTLLGIAARHRARERALYGDPFALSAKTWQKSTRLSVETLFGAGTQLLTSPPGGPQWTKAQLAPRVHFINCHGNTLTPTYLGEFPEKKYFDAHDSAQLPNKVSEGTVIAAECCYGAELYDPKEAGGRPGICSTYLREGAYGFFGSTTIAYGPSEGNGQADLICRFFVEAVLGGASLGRAASEARHRFVSQFSHLDPSDLKTAAQFILLGDPSVHAVLAVPHALSRSRAVTRALASGTIVQGTRSFRRERIGRSGHNLAHTVGAAQTTRRKAPATVRALLESVARESGLRDAMHHSYRVKFPAQAKATSSAPVRASRRARSVHMIQGNRRGGRDDSGLPLVTAIIATLEGSRVVHIRRVHSR
jgi:hypothetical protein